MWRSTFCERECGPTAESAKSIRQGFGVQVLASLAKWVGCITAVATLLSSLPATDTVDDVVTTSYHLTARPWKPLKIPREQYLDAIEGECRFTAKHQDASGAVIDPFLKREHQYATPYFAYAVGTLVAAGRARDLLPSGVKAMEHATACFNGGLDSIPDKHGNFFIPVLTEALEVYRGHVAEAQWNTWRERMKKPLREVVSGAVNNWETYAMKGEWARERAGLVTRADAIKAIEADWRLRQHARIAPAPWFLYHDRTSDPDTLSVEAVGRGNLLALAGLGYDGPSGAEIRTLAEQGTRFSLLLQDPSGQVPANGRTDDHVWVDVGYQLAFEVMAERMRTQHDSWLAGQFRRASLLSFQSIGRWRRTDGPWSGSFYISKNHFDPSLRVGYQDASQYSNYNGSLMFHLSEAYRARTAAIDEEPAPAEIGGYAFALERAFSSVMANAGGFQMQANLRGQIAESSGNFWTPLGVVRFARTGWETRLGPSDGALTAAGGVSFAPTFSENGHWLRLSSLSARYEGEWSVQFAHPLLVRCAITYHPRQGKNGPSFRDEFVLTPDGVLSTIVKTSSGEQAWGVTWPLLENDGTPLPRFHTEGVEAVGYPESGDRENFVALDTGSQLTPETTLRGAYGDLRAIRVTVPDKANHTFVYPANATDPSADSLRHSFATTPDGFRTLLGRVSGSIYVGRTSAGGVGDGVDLAGHGKPDVKFSERCGFLLQLRQGKVVSAEADREVDGEIQGKKVHLSRYKPVWLSRN
jgi:hypothetical protein